MEKERQVLVIFPHPDDEAYGVSGTIATHVEAGTPVAYACLTLGEMGRNLGVPPFTTREHLPTIRKKELEEACEIMGISDLRMLGYRDKTIEFENQPKLINHLKTIIEDIDPSLVITFYPGFSVHPDHDATGAAVIEAVKLIEIEKRPKVHCVAFSRNCEDFIGKPDIINNIEKMAEIKLAAIEAHRSQTQYTIQAMKDAYKTKDPKAAARLNYERFWTYTFE